MDITNGYLQNPEEIQIRYSRGKIMCLLVFLIFLLMMITVIVCIHPGKSHSSITDSYNFDETSSGISEFGSEEYECYGTCFCDAAEIERRTTQTFFTSCRSLSLIVVALTSFLVYEEAKKAFIEECEVGGFECDDFSEVHVEVDSCEEVDRLAIESAYKDGETRLNDYIFNRIERVVRHGFKDEDTIISDICNHLRLPRWAPWWEKGVDDEEAKKECAIYVRKCIEKQKEEQKHWPDVTDCDRLDAVFDELNEIGIVSEQYKYCKQCFEELCRRLKPGEEDAGVAYYHPSDVDNVMNGRDLTIKCNAKETSNDWLVVNKVFQILRKHGLKCEIRGRYRVKVQMDWKRRSE